MLSPFFALGAPWTAREPLPGGNIPWDGVDAFIATTRERWPFLSAAHARRLVQAYGTRIDKILGSATSLADLGECFGTDLTAAEVRYLMEREWAGDVDDILWRRSKLGLQLSMDERASLVRFMAQARSMSAAE